MKVLNTEIDMLCVHDQKGDIKPIRFRIIEDDENRVIKIQKVVNKAEERIAGINYIKYTCMVTVNDVQVLCEIHYSIQQALWKLFKI